MPLHRPDVKPGKGYRILEQGEILQAVDEMQELVSRRPFKLKWSPVADRFVGRAVDHNWTACRTNRPLK